MTDNERDMSHCPVCGHSLGLDQERGYYCPRCGWDESAEMEDRDVWIMSRDRDDAEDRD